MFLMVDGWWFEPVRIIQGYELRVYVDASVTYYIYIILWDKLNIMYTISFRLLHFIPILPFHITLTLDRPLPHGVWCDDWELREDSL